MVSWIIFFIAGVALSLWFTAWVIPKIMFRTNAATMPVGSKAVDRYKDDFGETVVYVPSSTARQYIKRYRIGRDSEGLYFCGELAKNVAFAEYELTVYNADNELIQILRIQEKFNSSNATAVTRLPDKTDYVQLRLVCLDDNPIPAERKRFNLRYGLWLAALCACIAFVVDFLIWLTVSFVLRCLNDFVSVTLQTDVWAAILGIAALFVVIVTCAVSLGGFFLRKRGDTDE